MTNEQIYFIIVPLLTLFIGFLFGNWMAIGRDKRKEFNEVAIPIHLALLKQLDELKRRGFPTENNVLSKGDLDKLRIYVSRCKGARYERAKKNYTKSYVTGWKKTFEDNDRTTDCGGLFGQAIKELTKYTKPR